MIRKLFICLTVPLLLFPAAHAQLTLTTCREKAQANYPLVRQHKLLEMAGEYDLENVATGNLPQVTLSGKASYQSTVTTLPVSLPGITIKGLPKDQYNISAEVMQNIWDGGRMQAQKELTRASTEERQRQVDVTMYALHERVDQLFFSILLQDEQLRQNDLLTEELERSRRQVESYIRNGVANGADLDAVKTQLLTTRQQRTGIAYARRAYLRMLALLIGENIPEGETLVKPEPPAMVKATVNRPELKWYDAQINRLNVSENALKTAYRPTFSLFAQGGIGNPGLNMLKNGWDPYYIIGARMTWNFSSLYTLKNDRRHLDVQRRLVETTRDGFLLDTSIRLTEQDEAARALQEQMKDDDEIIRMRTNVRKAAEARVAGGTLSVTEMLRELTAESLARQDKATHEIQLLMRLYRKQYLTN